MAGNGQKKEQSGVERLAPGAEAGKSSRVSRAAGSIGSSSVRAEARPAAGSNRSRAASNASGRAGGQYAHAKATNRKGTPASSASRKGASGNSATPADSRVIQRARERWDDMQPHEQQRLFSVVLLVLALFLLLALTIWRDQPLFKPLTTFFASVFSWAQIPLCLGLIAFAIAHLIEGARNIRFIRWSLVLGLLGLLVLLMVESQLLFGHTTGGIIGGLLALPMSGWGFGAHVLVLGLFLILILVTFRITMSQLQNAWYGLQKIFLDPRASRADDASPRISPFLGQRPRFSRYVNEPNGGLADDKRALDDDEFDDEDDDDEDMDPDDDAFDEVEEEDPRNSITPHLNEVGRVKKGARPAQQLDRTDLKAATKGARQQPLPEPPQVEPLEDMEPLAPNPLHARAPQAARQAAVPEIVSPWKQPDTSLFNSPEDTKVQLLGDDTSTLAKTIQDTLRSFRVEAEVRPEDISIGPTVIRFGIRPTGKPLMNSDDKGRIVPVKDSAGNIVYETRTRVSRIMALQNDLALVLESKTIRMEAPVPGRPYVGVEIPNKNSRLVTLREILESKEFQSAKMKSKLTVALGKDVAGAVRVGRSRANAAFTDCRRNRCRKIGYDQCNHFQCYYPGDT